MTAIITDVHYRMSLTLIRTLAEEGFTVIACERASCATHATPPLGFYSKYSHQCITLSDDGYWEELFALCQRQGERPILFPVGAATLSGLSLRMEEFSAVAHFLCPPPQTLDQLNHKGEAGVLAQQMGVPVPASYGLEEDIPFPCVVKPVCGEKLGLSASERYTIVHNRDQLESAYERFSQMGTQVIIQQYLSGDGMGCCVVAHEGKVCASLCHRRIRQYPISGGPSSCCESIHHPQLVDYATKMVAATTFSGFAMFEFKEDGTPYFLEVNPRIWGSFPLVSVAHSQLILSYVAAATGEKFSPVPSYEGRRMQFILSDLMAALSHLKAGQPTVLLSVLLDALNPNVKEGLFQWSDWKPFLVYTKSLLSRRSHGG